MSQLLGQLCWYVRSEQIVDRRFAVTNCRRMLSVAFKASPNTECSRTMPWFQAKETISPQWWFACAPPLKRPCDIRVAYGFRVWRKVSHDPSSDSGNWAIGWYAFLTLCLWTRRHWVKRFLSHWKIWYDDRTLPQADADSVLKEITR